MITFSLCQASYKSNGSSKQVRDLWFNRASNASRLEHCLGFEFGDSEVSMEYGIPASLRSGVSSDGLTRFITSEPTNLPSAVSNWNLAASISTNDVLIAVADDLVPDYGWDVKLESHLSIGLTELSIYTFSDDRCHRMASHEKDTILPRHPCMNRATYKELGYLFDPIFDSVGPDVDLLITALKKGWLRDCRSVRLHHSIGKIVSQNGFVNCGCQEVQTRKRSDAQVRMHSQSHAATQLLSEKWGVFDVLLAKIACVNRMSDYVIKSMRVGRKNKSLRLIFESLTRYGLNQFLNPSRRS